MQDRVAFITGFAPVFGELGTEPRFVAAVAHLTCMGWKHKACTAFSPRWCTRSTASVKALPHGGAPFASDTPVTPPSHLQSPQGDTPC